MLSKIFICRSSWDVDMTAAHQQSKKRDGNGGEGGERGRKYHSLDSAMDKMGNTTDAGECLRFVRKHWEDGRGSLKWERIGAGQT